MTLRYGDTMIMLGLEIKRRPSSAKFNTVEFEEFTEFIRRWGSEHSVFLPLPNEAVIPDYYYAR